MNAPKMIDSAWTSINQELLVAEFARLKARLRRDEDVGDGENLREIRSRLSAPAAIDSLVSRFGLTDFERDILLLAAGVEMDSELAALCTDKRRIGAGPVVSLGLALGVLPQPHWSALVPTRPLRYWRFIELSGEGPLVGCRLHIDERILHFLAGIGYLDQRLQPLMKPVPEPGTLAASQRRIGNRIAAIMEEPGAEVPVVQLWGSDEDGKRDAAACAAARLGLILHAMVTDDLPAGPDELETVARLWRREAILLHSALLIDCQGNPPPPRVGRFAYRLGGVTFVALPEPVKLEGDDLRFRLDKPGAQDRWQLWREALGDGAESYTDELSGVAMEFRLSGREIQRAATLVSQMGHGAAGEGHLRQACLTLQSNRLGGLARQIEPRARWDELVLPAAQKAMLRQIVIHLRHRRKVYQDWGFSAQSGRGLGIAALFAGESGTGKTMAAVVLANELDRELFRIDLSAVVSKYIGETEKNLARVFDSAEETGAILLFDEADALFGKRSEVRDSHDRYANIEVSYLLQRMEAYRGLAILTTNQKSALDSAFHRRLRFVIHFPFPATEEREAIWRNIFPSATPTKGLDFRKLARLQVTGGNIRNIALSAAFIAAEEGAPVAMDHLLQGARDEAMKRERSLSDGETRGWV